jgi:hypothetical protein
MSARHYRRDLIWSVLPLALVLLTSCQDDPATPPVENPYVIDFAGFARFSFRVLPPSLNCLEPGDVLVMAIRRELSAYSVELGRVSGRYCASSESLLVYFSPQRTLTQAEVSLVLSTFRQVKIEVALPPSCSAWSPIRDCLARWDDRVFDRTCTIDHLTPDTVGRLFALVDSLDTGARKVIPNTALRPSSAEGGHWGLDR